MYMILRNHDILLLPIANYKQLFLGNGIKCQCILISSSCGILSTAFKHKNDSAIGILRHA